MRYLNFILVILLLIIGCQEKPSEVTESSKPKSIYKTPFTYERISYTLTTRVLTDAPVVLGLEGEFENMSSEEILNSNNSIDEECYIEGTVRNGDDYTLYIEKRRGFGTQIRQLFGPSAMNIEPALESQEVHSVTYNRGEVIFKNVSGQEIGRHSLGNVVDTMEFRTGIIPVYPGNDLSESPYTITAEFLRSIGESVTDLPGGDFSVTSDVFGSQLETIFDGSTGLVAKSVIRQNGQPSMETTFEYGTSATGVKYISRRENLRYDYINNQVFKTRSIVSISNFTSERY